MSVDSRQYTIIIAPNTSSKVLRLSLNQRAVQTVCGVFVLVALLGIYAGFTVYRHGALTYAYSSLKQENEDLKRANESYESAYAKIKGQVSYIEDLSKSLAREAKLEPLPEVGQQVGSGGPEAIASFDKAIDTLEGNIRQISDRLRSDQLRLASIPSGLPVSGYITDGFGMRRNPFGGGSETHPGLDISVEFGTPVSVTADGVVIWASPMGGYGNLVAVYHSNGIVTRYAHLSKITVEAGQRLNRGAQIGLAGSTGRSTAPHVHYEVRENDQPVDPQRYIAPPRP